MKYYLIEITTYVDETPDAKGIYSYDTETDAVANFHSKMGGAMKNANYASELVQVISGTGKVIKTEFWARPIEVTSEPVSPEETTEENS